MTAVIVALLTLPLAALRPFQQPTAATSAATPASATAPASATEALPESFKVSISDAAKPKEPANAPMWGSASLAPSSKQKTALTITPASPWSCDRYPVGSSLSVHSHIDGNNQIREFLISSPDRCAEAAVIGKAVFSPDETRLAQLAVGGFARFRERTSTFDRAVTITPVGDGSLSYVALVNGRTAPFDGTMTAWLSQFIPEVLREAGINVPERVARIRSQGGVSAVLEEIGRIRSSGAKSAHYQELIKSGPLLTAGETERLAQQAARDLKSSGDLSTVIQQLPKTSLRNPQTRQAVAGALSQIKSSGDRTNTLQVLAPNADPEMLVMLAKVAETLPSSGDKANFLMTTASEYLTPGTAMLRNAFFKTASTLQSSGDMANVLISAIPYGHSSPQVTLDVIETSKNLVSSGDAANVLLSLISQRAIQPGNTRATVEVIERTLTMASSGDRANVLISLANRNLLTNSEVRDAFLKAAAVLPSDGDRTNVLAAAARR